MTEYTNNSPTFHSKIDIVDTSTPDNGDNISLADRQNFDNILVLAERIGDLTGLTTTAKNDLVAAINELVSGKVSTSDIIAIAKGGTGASTADGAIKNLFASFTANAAFHNSLYRGKNLGTEVTQDQWDAISAGTFDDMYIGDYWTINSRVYRIAAFDYWLHHGDTECTTHHIVLVPDANLYTAKMNDSNVTTGGYIGSKMYTENLASAKTTIKGDFNASHILSHREYLTNAITSGYASAGSWYDSDIELMNEVMVYGTDFFTPHNSLGATIPNTHTVDTSQLPLFALEHSRICNRANWWLRDVVSATGFATVAYGGSCTSTAASHADGVRPAFGIKA